MPVYLPSIDRGIWVLPSFDLLNIIPLHILLNLME
jgi:hypothetical protein